MGLCHHYIGPHIKYAARHFGRMCMGATKRATLLEDVPCANKDMQTRAQVRAQGTKFK